MGGGGQHPSPKWPPGMFMTPSLSSDFESIFYKYFVSFYNNTSTGKKYGLKYPYGFGGGGTYQTLLRTPTKI